MNVILLNGPSSAGKSSLAEELKRLIDVKRKCRVIALDDYLPMTPDEPIWEDDVFEVTPKMCDDIEESLNDGFFVVVDHVITSERIFEEVVYSIGKYTYKKVLVTCDVDVLRKREKERGNRFPGSSEASLQYLYPKNGYDIVVDTTNRKSGQIAKQLYNYYCSQKEVAKMRIEHAAMYVNDLDAAKDFFVT